MRRPKIFVKDGAVFGRLTVLSREPDKLYSGVPSTMWKVRCSCGVEKVIRGVNMTKGYTSSCGCLLRDASGARSTVHGLHRSKEYGIWRGMKYRCFNKDHPAYKDYGARGIVVSLDWMEFTNFYRDMGQCPSPLHEIDRIDNNGPYCKDNCKWSTRRQQLRNTRRTRWIEYNGERRCMKEWSEVTGISYQAIRHRLMRGWSVEKTLTAKATYERS